MRRTAYCLLACTFVLLARSSAHAQTPTHTVQLPLGSVFEILVDGTETSRQTGWILKKDGDFVQAERNSMFQTRFTQEGEYQLEAQTENRGEKMQLVLTILVDADTSSSTPSSGDLVVMTEEFSEENQSLLHLQVSREDISQLLMDVDMQQDTNGDGDAVNDNALRSTFFSQGKGNLYVWLPERAPEQTMLIGARLENNSIDTQQITVGSTPESVTEPEPDEEVLASTIEFVDEGDGTFQFYVNAEDSAVQQLPFIPLWKFGDGSQSMLDAPKHRYAAAGTYTVQVIIRSLEDGQVLMNERTTIVVDENDVPPVGSNGGDNNGSEQSSSSASSTNDASGDSGDNDGSMLGTIFTAIVLLIISLCIGALVVFILAKFRNKDLHEHVASAEDKLVQSPADTTQDPPPMEMPDDVIDVEAKEEVIEQPPENAEPAKVPSWLAASQDSENGSRDSESGNRESVVEEKKADESGMLPAEERSVNEKPKELTKEEKERERKRRKRQRYRQNKKAREQAEKAENGNRDSVVEEKGADESGMLPAEEVPSTPKEMDIPPVDDSEVKFVISADSVETPENTDESEEKKA